MVRPSAQSVTRASTQTKRSPTNRRSITRRAFDAASAEKDSTASTCAIATTSSSVSAATARNTVSAATASEWEQECWELTVERAPPPLRQPRVDTSLYGHPSGDASLSELLIEVLRLRKEEEERLGRVSAAESSAEDVTSRFTQRKKSKEPDK